jgi:hypothetical protein
MSVFLHALALQYFRGIGPDVQKLNSFRDFNFFIGANNSGKSTILDYIARYLNSSKSTALLYKGQKSGRPLAAIGIPVDVFETNALAHLRTKMPQLSPEVANAIPRFCQVLANDDVIWIRKPIDGASSPDYLNRPQVADVRKGLNDTLVNQVWSALTGARGGGLEQHWIPESLSELLSAHRPSLQFPEVQLIAALRQIGPKAEVFSDFSGRGLIDRLAEIQSPDHDKRYERQTFDQINRFLQTVIGRESAQIEVPHNREHILAHMGQQGFAASFVGNRHSRGDHDCRVLHLKQRSDSVY